MVDDKLMHSLIMFIEHNFVADRYYHSGLSRLHNSNLYMGTLDGYTKQYRKMNIYVDISFSDIVSKYACAYEILLTHEDFEIFLLRVSHVVSSNISPGTYRDFTLYNNISVSGDTKRIIDILKYSR